MVLFQSKQNIRRSLLSAEITAFCIGKQSIHLYLQFPSPLKPVHIEIGFVKVQQTLNQERIVLGKAVGRPGPLPIAAKQSSSVQILLQESGSLLGSPQIGRLLEDLKRPGKA